MTQRWKGILNLRSGSSQHEFRVLASVACTSSGSLVVPASNAIFFTGDRVTESGNPIVERLSQLENIAAALLPKLGQTINLWIIEASRYKGPFACYENILPSLTASGDPLGYKPKGLPAARACFSILHDCLEQVRAAQRRDKNSDGKAAELQGKENRSSEECVQMASPFEPFRDLVNSCPPTILLGFSKGGVVLNQMLAEIVHYEETSNAHDDQSLGRLGIQDRVSNNEVSEEEKRTQLLPSTVEAFLSRIEEVHYVDVGLNCHGAYQTDPRVLEGLAKAARSRLGFYVGIHGTPRQWQDSNRKWIVMEKNRFVKLLKEAASKYGGGKLRVSERLYFSQRLPDLQMHFEIIDKLILR